MKTLMCAALSTLALTALIPAYANEQQPEMFRYSTTTAFLMSADQNTVRIQLVSPKNKVVMGNNQLILEVQDSKTGKLMSVKGLEVKVSMPMGNMAPMNADVEVKPDSQSGRFTVNTYFSMRGTWQVTAKVNDGNRRGQSTFTLDVR